MDADLDTLATALYVTIDDLVRNNPNLLPPRPRVSITSPGGCGTAGRTCATFSPTSRYSPGTTNGYGSCRT